MTPRRPTRLLTDSEERLRRTVWPRGTRSRRRRPAVAVVTVNYNTRDMLARLLFSLARVLPAGALARVVVVDNGSTDGSGELLEALAGAGLVDLVRNHRHPYHGPGLNRGLSHLARGQRRGDRAPIDLVWVLDSDVVVLRSDALSEALAVMDRTGAVLLGQEQPYDQPRPRLARYVHPSAMLIDPAVVWRHSVPAFLEDGAPAVVQQHALRARGHHIVDHRWYDDGALLHVGGGTLDALVRDAAAENRYYEWAREGHGQHFHGVPGGADRLARVDACFRAEVGELTPGSLLRACAREPRVVF